MIEALRILLLLAITGDTNQANHDNEVALGAFSSCGQSAIWLMLRDHGANVSLKEIQKAMPAAEDGTNSVSELCILAKKHGLNLVVSSLRDGVAVPSRSIVHLNGSPFRSEVAGQTSGHFVYVLQSGADDVIFLDPPFPATRMPREEFLRLASGTFLEQRLNSIFFDRLSIYVPMTGFIVASLWLVGRLVRVRDAFRPSQLWLGGGFAGVVVLLLIYVGFSRHESGLAKESVDKKQLTGLSFEHRVRLGDIPLGKRLIDLSLKNSSSDVIRIVSLSSSCRCAAPKYPDMIRAGETVQIRVEIAVDEGGGEASLSLETNHGSDRIDLDWFGEVDVRVVPPRIHQVLIYVSGMQIRVGPDWLTGKFNC